MILIVALAQTYMPPMMWSANYGGPYYGFQTYMKTPMMLSMLGGIVGDERLQAAIKDYTEAWSFKHPSPWDFVHFVSSELDEDLGWFWYYWLFTTESVEGSIATVVPTDDGAVVRVRREVLRVHAVVTVLPDEQRAGNE